MDLSFSAEEGADLSPTSGHSKTRPETLEKCAGRKKAFHTELIDNQMRTENTEEEGEAFTIQT